MVAMIFPPSSTSFSSTTQLVRWIEDQPHDFHLLSNFTKPHLLEFFSHFTYDLHSSVDVTILAEKCFHATPGSTSDELLQYLSKQIAHYTYVHPDYAILAGRINMAFLYKSTSSTFSKTTDDIHHLNPILLNPEYKTFIETHASDLDALLIPEFDFYFTELAVAKLRRVYLCKPTANQITERPHILNMRIAVGVNYRNPTPYEDTLKAIKTTYQHLAERKFTFATPIIIHAGYRKDTMASCYLESIADDSLDEIYNTVKLSAMLSKDGGGLGLTLDNIRSTDAPIQGTGGRSRGIPPLLKVMNATMKYADQGGGQRQGSCAVYLSPWHADYERFLDAADPIKGDLTADLFYANWIPDLFYERVNKKEQWSLFCPHKVPLMSKLNGREFEEYYKACEAAGLASKTMPAVDLFNRITRITRETGKIYNLSADNCNRKSNQKNLGNIACSNLCAEIIEYTSPDEVAVCNLASLNLTAYVITDTAKKIITVDNVDTCMNWEDMRKVVHHLVKDMNRIIDTQQYYTEEMNGVSKTRNSNSRHRPIALGVQGLQNVFLALMLPFDSPIARRLNELIFEHIYYYALDASCSLAERDGYYESFPGSPFSKGDLQMDLWKQCHPSLVINTTLDWPYLRQRIIRYGTRNSLLTACMPTASTAIVLDNYEGIDPMFGVSYNQNGLQGQHEIVDRTLVSLLSSRGQWNRQVYEQITRNNGSVSTLDCLSPAEKLVFRNAFEIPQKALIDMSADRGVYMDHSQSFNVYLDGNAPLDELDDYQNKKLQNIHFYGWKKGLKTLSYYTRDGSSLHADRVTLSTISAISTISTGTISKMIESPKNAPNNFSSEDSGPVCRKEEGCVVCSA